MFQESIYKTSAIWGLLERYSFGKDNNEHWTKREKCNNQHFSIFSKALKHMLTLFRQWLVEVHAMLCFNTKKLLKEGQKLLPCFFHFFIYDTKQSRDASVVSLCVQRALESIVSPFCFASRSPIIDSDQVLAVMSNSQNFFLNYGYFWWFICLRILLKNKPLELLI